MPGIVWRIIHALSHLILKTNLGDRHCFYPHLHIFQYAGYLLFESPLLIYSWSIWALLGVPDCLVFWILLGFGQWESPQVTSLVGSLNTAHTSISSLFIKLSSQITAECAFCFLTELQLINIWSQNCQKSHPLNFFPLFLFLNATFLFACLFVLKCLFGFIWRELVLYINLPIFQVWIDYFDP